MATPKKKTSKTHMKKEELPSGIRLLDDGRYLASSGAKKKGTSKRRTQLIFVTSEEAIEWKTASDERFKNEGLTISRAEWNLRKAGRSAGAIAGMELKETTVRAFLAPTIELLAADQKRPAERRGLGRLLVRFMTEQGAMDRSISSISGDVARYLPGWLQEQNLGKQRQTAALRMATLLWDAAIACDHTFKNPFRGLERSRQQLAARDNRGQIRTRRKALAWLPEQLVAVAFLLRDIYLFPYWLMVVTAIRRSELFGIQLEDWDSARRILSLYTQRTGSPAKGFSDVKTDASYRSIQVCELIGSLIDDYIAANHPPRPSGEADLKAWGRRLLIVGVKGGAMNPQSMCDAVSDACEVLGLTVENVGKFSALHHLRKTLSEMLQDPALQLRGSAISAYLGHENAVATGDRTISAVTLSSYSPGTVGAEKSLVAAIDAWVADRLLPAAGGDLLHLGSFDDGVDLIEAARLLSAGPGTYEVADVQSFIQEGDLIARSSDHVGSLETRTTLVSASAVTALAASLVRSAADTYSAQEAAEILATDHQGLYRLAQEGLVIEREGDPTRRVGARGFGTGSLPGGGRRFDMVSVDALASADAVGITRRRTWLRIGEAATVLGRSSDTIRRMADRGELTCWRDPRSAHGRRFIDPESVKAVRLSTESITVSAASVLLALAPAEIRALVKLGVLVEGSDRGTVLKASALGELQRRSAA